MPRLASIIVSVVLLLGVSASAQEDAPARGIQITPRYRIDARMMGETAPGSKLELMGAEAEIFASFGDKVDAAVQIPIATSMSGRGKDMHYGNAYAVVKGRIGRPTVKVGQFVIPFGNLVDYETHTRILQTLYPYSLGIRIDTGLEVEGFIDSDTEYFISATTGNGPYRGDPDGGVVLTGRVARQMLLGDDDLKVGVSALRGRLPVFSVMTDPLMDGNNALLVDVASGMMVPQNDPRGFTSKARYAVDVEYYRGADLIRLELVSGTDHGEPAGGYWLQIEHPLSYKTAITGLVGGWNQAHGRWRNLGLGLEHKLSDTRIARLALERRKASEHGMSMRMNMLTMQFLTEF